MFRLKVDYKKRILIGLLNFIPMIALVTLLVIFQ